MSSSIQPDIVNLRGRAYLKMASLAIEKKSFYTAEKNLKKSLDSFAIELSIRSNKKLSTVSKGYVKKRAKYTSAIKYICLTLQIYHIFYNEREYIPQALEALKLAYFISVHNLGEKNAFTLSVKANYERFKGVLGDTVAGLGEFERVLVYWKKRMLDPDIQFYREMPSQKKMVQEILNEIYRDIHLRRLKKKNRFYVDKSQTQLGIERSKASFDQLTNIRKKWEKKSQQKIKEKNEKDMDSLAASNNQITLQGLSYLDLEKEKKKLISQSVPRVRKSSIKVTEEESNKIDLKNFKKSQVIRKTNYRDPNSLRAKSTPHRIQSASFGGRIPRRKHRRYYFKKIKKAQKQKLAEEKEKNPHIPKDLFLTKKEKRKYKEEKLKTQKMGLLYKDKFWNRREKMIKKYKNVLPESGEINPDLVSYINKEKMEKKLEELKKNYLPSDIDEFFRTKVMTAPFAGDEQFQR